jgi:hypothetical protein
MWKNRKYNYAILNISDNPSIREYRVIHGTPLSRQVIADNLSESEFVKTASSLLEKVNEVRK